MKPSNQSLLVHYVRTVRDRELRKAHVGFISFSHLFSVVPAILMLLAKSKLIGVSNMHAMTFNKLLLQPFFWQETVLDTNLKNKNE